MRGKSGCTKLANTLCVCFVFCVCVCVDATGRQVRTCEGEMIVLCESGESSSGAAVTVAIATSVNARSRQTNKHKLCMQPCTHRITGAQQLAAFAGFDWRNRRTCNRAGFDWQNRRTYNCAGFDWRNRRTCNSEMRILSVSDGCSICFFAVTRFSLPLLFFRGRLRHGRTHQLTCVCVHFGEICKAFRPGAHYSHTFLKV